MGGYKEVLESAAKRIRSLERVQKGMLLFAAVLPLAFFVAYFVTTGREGYEYRNAILVPEAGADEGADGTVYAGTIMGNRPFLRYPQIKPWSFAMAKQFAALIQLKRIRPPFRNGEEM